MSIDPRHARPGRPTSHRDPAPGDLDDPVVSASPAFRCVAERIARFARTDEPVVLQGESGTGKTRLAAWLHARSCRAGKPFQSVNMAELDDNLASSEMFGHLAGAFTGAERQRKGAFATAHGGTLFLDEVGKCSLANQGRLLRAIESRTFRPLGSDLDVTVDVRLILAASEPLEGLVESGRMLRDFLPRLGPFRVVIPPLRQRREDIPSLALGLVTSHAPRLGYIPGALPIISAPLLVALCAYDWPDNLRELDGLIRRLLVDAEGRPTLDTDLLVEDLAKYRRRWRRIPLGDRHHDIELAIERAAGNKSRAARTLGISRATVNRHIAAARRVDAQETIGE
jgi:DNA-binding NtrC family response regulator